MDETSGMLIARKTPHDDVVKLLTELVTELRIENHDLKQMLINQRGLMSGSILAKLQDREYGMSEMSKSDEWLPVHDPLRLQRKRPGDYPEVEMMRAGWPEPQKTAWKDIHPLMNIGGLYWRPAK